MGGRGPPERADAVIGAGVSRPVGASGVHVSALGVGTAPFGDVFGAITDQDALDVVATALAAGLGYFDTAPLYGCGLAERRLAAALAELGDPAVTISTKVGRVLDERTCAGWRFDFSRDGIRRSLAGSLQRLRRDAVDIALLHDPDEHEQEVYDTAWAAVAELREQGLVRAIGVGMNQWQMPLRFLARLDVDVVMLAGRRTLLDASGAQEFLPAAAAAGVAVLTAGVFNSGILADPHDGAWYDYHPAAPEVLARARALAAVCGEHGVPLATAALQYAHADTRSTATVVGAASARVLAASIDALAAPVPAALWTDLLARGLIAAPPALDEPPALQARLGAQPAPADAGEHA